MRIISKKGNIQKINLHDAEIRKIICDYDKGIVEIPIIMYGKKQFPAILIFENMRYIEINRMEPWGPGIYVFAVNIDNNACGDDIKVNIVLNSGDYINIMALRMIYCTEE